jgi:hypothetical protein
VVQIHYMVALFQGMGSEPPLAEQAASYHETIGEPAFPVFADTQGRLLLDTPYQGNELPGKCVLSPEMEILGCVTGHSLDGVEAIVLEHAAR